MHIKGEVWHGLSASSFGNSAVPSAGDDTLTRAISAMDCASPLSAMCLLCHLRRRTRTMYQRLAQRPLRCAFSRAWASPCFASAPVEIRKTASDGKCAYVAARQVPAVRQRPFTSATGVIGRLGEQCARSSAPGIHQCTRLKSQKRACHLPGSDASTLPARAKLPAAMLLRVPAYRGRGAVPCCQAVNPWISTLRRACRYDP